MLFWQDCYCINLLLKWENQWNREMQSKVKLPVYDKTLLNLYSLYKVYVYLVRKEEKKKSAIE